MVQKIVDVLRTLQPDKAESSAIRKLQSVQAQLDAAQAQLQEAGLAPKAPGTPELEISDDVPEEESEGTPSASLPTKRKTAQTTSLGATPKKKPRLSVAHPSSVRSLDKVFKTQQEKAAQGSQTVTPAQPAPVHRAPPEPPTLTAEEMLPPGRASLKDQPPTGSSDVRVKKWLQQYPQETQQMVLKLQTIISESKPKKDELQTAAIQYGLNLNLVNKMSVTSLLKVISLGALQAA